MQETGKIFVHFLAQKDIILSRINEPRGRIQVLAGPRQVGKSTLMDQVLAETDIPYTLAKADNVLPEDIGWIKRTWESARGTMVAKRQKEHLLVIDEIHPKHTYIIGTGGIPLEDFLSTDINVWIE